MEENLYRIALSYIDMVGPIIARTLVEHCGSAQSVFKERKALLQKIPNIGSERIKKIASADVLHKAEEELRWVEKHGIEIVFYKNERFPRRLNRCADGPTVLFVKGKADLNPERSIAVVGTRKMTSHGETTTKKFIRQWSSFNPTIVSGLALGVDTASHHAALKNGIPTIGVLGHGHATMFPAANRPLAQKIIDESGAVITEFPSKTRPDAPNFPRRNRIVAGMTDATIVIEAAIKGGALITGQLASSYQRDVFALPGRTSDPLSAGCLNLIRNNEAALLSRAEDVIESLGWENSQQSSPQVSLPIDLSTEEAGIYSALSQGPLQIDELAHVTSKPISQLLATLTTMELCGLIISLPGKRYAIQ